MSMQPFDFQPFGRMLVSVGALIVVIGIVLIIGSKFGIGELKGDILIKKGNFVFYFPLVTSIVLSVVMSIIFSIFRRF